MKIYKGLSKLFMAFNHGKSIAEDAPIVRYKGIGVVKVLAVNPTREQWNELFPNSTNTDPIEYTGTIDVDGKSVRTVRVTFVVETVDCPENKGIVTRIPISFRLSEQYYMSTAKKIKVMDDFGRTAWVTQDEFKTHSVPVYADGPARISSNYRAVYRGEDYLTAFIRTFLNLPDIDFYNSNTGKWEQRKDVDASRGGLDEVKKYFSGDISEIVKAIALAPDNALKVVFGVRHGSDNRDYQTFYDARFLRFRQRNAANIMADIKADQERGAYANMEFSVEPLHEWRPAPTDFTNVNSSTLPETTTFYDEGDAVDDLPPDDLPFGDETPDAKEPNNPWGL